MAGVSWWRVRRTANLFNGSTLLGLAVAYAGRAHVVPGPRGLLLAHGYRFGFPVAGAFTVGDVVLTRHPAGWFDHRPRLLGHEERHSWQYAACLGLPMLPLYGLAAGYSWLRARDVGSHNAFERLAGLAEGGYRVS